MVRLKSSANKQHVVNFTDHAGQRAKMTWSKPSRNILIPLPSLCFYFLHPDFSLNDLDLRKFHGPIRDGDGDPSRFEMFCIPGASDADCAQHYRDELKARGDVFEQVREVDKAFEDWEHGGNLGKDVQYATEQEPHGKLPGLDRTWKRDDEEQTFDIVQFDPALTQEDYDPYEWERRKPQAPFKTTRVSATKKSKVE
ncbi:hypothetical protein IL306_002890, partial [Fusarium sp. DS 682]